MSEEQLNLLVIEKLENKILFFSSGTIFWVNLNKIKEAILEKFPQIDKIEISRNFPNNLDVLVTERKGLATFCHEEKCFILDKEGIVFDPIRNDISNEARENQLLIKIIDKSETEPYNLGKRVIEKEDLIWLLEINSQLNEDLNIPVKEFIISSGEKLTVLTQEDWELYFNLQEDVKWQLTKLKALLEEKIPENKRKDLEYIELRFGNFANPRYKD